MKLLFVHDRFGAQAGAESNLYDTAVELKRRGHEIGLAHGPGTGTAEERWHEVFESRFQIVPADGGRQMESAISEFRPDVIYVHNPPGLPVVSVLARSHRPVVRMVHDHQLYCLRGCKYPAWNRRPCRRALSPYCIFPCGGSIGRGAGKRGRSMRWVSYAAKKKEMEFHRRFRRLIVGSDYMRTELLRNGFREERIETHAPVPPSSETGGESNFDGRNLIVYAGQIIRGKGVDLLLDSLARVRTPFECIIFGNGHHRAHCEQLSRRLGLSDRVRFAGYVPQTVLAEHYRRATAAVVSSVWPEPFGMAGLEAMRFGLPVVAFDAGGIGEWLKDGVNGFLVPWMDRGAYARALDALLADKALARRLGTAGRMLAAGRFGFQRYALGLETLFARVQQEDEQEDEQEAAA